MNYTKFRPISDPIPHTVPQVTFYFIPVVASGVIFGFTLGLTTGLTLGVIPCVTFRMNPESTPCLTRSLTS